MADVTAPGPFEGAGEMRMEGLIRIRKRQGGNARADETGAVGD